MAVIFFKRYRMQIDLRDREFGELDPPAGIRLHAWHPRHLNAHAEAKFHSFRHELDANVFPCLADADGCCRLMKEITSRQGFLPEATWLVTALNPETGRRENCGTVQGVCEKIDVGWIQNIGIVASQRGKGLGSLMVQTALKGFQQVGVKFVTLEVTSHNTAACRLYHRLGFESRQTVYKSVQIDNLH